MTATARAAKVTGTDVDKIRANYRNFKEAPNEIKGAIIIAYRIMDNYTKKVMAVEPIEN